VNVFWQLYIDQAVGGELDLMVLFGGAEELYIRLPKTPSHYIFALKIATVVFAETLDNISLR
jgi:hypothetical protein